MEHTGRAAGTAEPRRSGERIGRRMSSNLSLFLANWQHRKRRTMHQRYADQPLSKRVALLRGEPHATLLLLRRLGHRS